jgi:hypothetical protein
MRRCEVYDYYEILSQVALNTVEDCYLRGISGDGIDFDGAVAGSAIRGCTIVGGNAANVDAIDLGNYLDGTISSNVVVEACRIGDFPFDKGVSIGEGSLAITVRDCIIYAVDSGVSVKDSAEAVVYHHTIAAAAHGLHLYEKVAGEGGGSATAWNNILWDCAEAVTLDPLSSLALTYSDANGGYPGEGNLDVDPGFRNTALFDFRMARNSPVIGQGRDGANMGARLPVGSSLVDTDGDLLPDPWEEMADLDPRDPSDAALDTDQDHLDNTAEYACGTDPQDPASALRLEVTPVPPDGARLEFDGVLARSYRIEATTLTEGAVWAPIAEFAPLTAASRVLFLDVQAGQARFYRLTARWDP